MGTKLKILIFILLLAIAVTGVVVGVNYFRTAAADYQVMTQPSPSREDAHRMQEQLVLFSEAGSRRASRSQLSCKAWGSARTPPRA